MHVPRRIWRREPPLSPAANTPGDGRYIVDLSPSAEIRALLAREINAFHSRTVPHNSERFAIRLVGYHDTLLAAVIGVISWQWLFIEAAWVSDALRGGGVGRELMRRAEDHARAAGCHSAWLDTFQARDFYIRLGYEVFGALERFPDEQTRYFMRRSL